MEDSANVWEKYGLLKEEWDALPEEERQAYLGVGEEENAVPEEENA